MAGKALTKLVRDYGYDIYADGPILCRTGEHAMQWKQVNTWVEWEKGAFITVLAGFQILGVALDLEDIVGDTYIKVDTVTLVRKHNPGELVSMRMVLERIRREFRAVQ